MGGMSMLHWAEAVPEPSAVVDALGWTSST